MATHPVLFYKFKANSYTMECSICLEAITKQTGSVILSCEHPFHFRCIDNWFSKQVWNDLEQTCPCCRSKGTDLDRCEVLDVYDNEEEDESDEDEESIADSEDFLVDRINEMLPRNDFLLERNDTTGQLLITSLEYIAMTRFRNLFGYLNDLEENGEEVVVSAPAPSPAPAWQEVVIAEEAPAPEPDPVPSSESSSRFPEGDPRRRVVYHWTREEGVIVPLPPNYGEELERQNSVQQDAARKIQAFFRGNQVRNTHGAAVALMRLFQQAYNL
jgi:hypothetical protein